MSNKIKAAIIGSGNIGTDLMIKILRTAEHIEMGVMVGIDPESDGLARAKRMGVATTAEGVEGLVKMPEFADIGSWAALKATMVYRGFYPTWKERFPVPTLTDEQAQCVKAHFEARGLL